MTGDTKVVNRGKGDGVFINSTGIGLIPAGVEVSPKRARPGDLVVINGAIAAKADTLGIETPVNLMLTRLVKALEETAASRCG